MAYVDITEPSGLGQVSVRRFPGCTLTPRFARRDTRGPRRSELSGLGFTFVSPLIRKMRTLISPLRMPAPPAPEPVIVAPAPAVMPRLPTAWRTLVAKPRPPTLIKPAITTAIRLAKTKIRKETPMWFWQKGIARARRLMAERLRTPSGATYRATDVKVVAGADPVSSSITGAGAPMTGQGISLKEPSPIVAVAPTVQGVTIVDEPTPTKMPLVTIKPIELETLPGEVPEVAKAGIPPIVFLIIAGIALPMLFKKKRKRR